MQLILKKDVQNIGEVGDIVNVKDGYARNYLIPNNLAEKATQGSLEARDRDMARIKAKAEKLHKEALEKAEKIQAAEVIELSAKAGESGKLFGTITTKKLAEELLAKTGIEVDRKTITLDNPINHIGDFNMTVKLSSKVKAQLRVSVSASETIKEAIIEEETTEEIYQSSGISTEVVDEDEILSGNILNAIRARTPWLFITLLGEFVAVNVAHHFDHTIAAIPIVAIFMPLLAGLGGNIGTQSITLMVRGLSTGQVTMSSAFHHIIREMSVGLVIGTIFGLIVTFATFGWQHSIELGVVVGIAMTINMTMATIIGTFTPFALKSLNIDPAVASGPVIATTIDVVGLVVYFTLVSTFLVKVF